MESIYVDPKGREIMRLYFGLIPVETDLVTGGGLRDRYEIVHREEMVRRLVQNSIPFDTHRAREGVEV